MLIPPGWDENEGVRIEIEAARALGIRICYLEVPERFIGLTLAQSWELPSMLKRCSKYCCAFINLVFRRDFNRSSTQKVEANSKRDPAIPS